MSVKCDRNEANLSDENVNLKHVVQCLVDGTLHEKLCLVCLGPLDEFSENIFTNICKADKEYCIADVLEKVCGLTVPPSENYSVCSSCFLNASSAYKFHLTTKRSETILNFYLNELDNNLTVLEGPIIADIKESICISLPIVEKSKDTFDYDLEGLALDKDVDHCIEIDGDNVEENKIADREQEFIIPEIRTIPETLKENVPIEKTVSNTPKVDIKQEYLDDEMDDDLIIVLDESGNTKYFRTDNTGDLVTMKLEEMENFDRFFRNVAKKDLKNLKEKSKEETKKERKKREPMAYMKCSRCDIEYRFTSKLVDHMKADHKVDLHFCKICKFITEDVTEYFEHLDKHSDCYICCECGRGFKKRSTMIAHWQTHAFSNQTSVVEGTHICDICGTKLSSEEGLKEHYDSIHEKKFTCFYCGRSYKGRASFESHVKKHEDSMGVNGERHPCTICNKSFPSLDKLELHTELEHDNVKLNLCQVCGVKLKSKDMLTSHMKTHTNRDFFCETCGRGFVDARALMWHRRLHTDDRPFKCEVCSKGFVSKNRRNAHSLCAHTAPTRRCPLCPSLFHLRSMVNSHIKKVHLKAHKRRNRSTKYSDVFWRTETVPVGELSVALQSDILDQIANIN